MIKHTKEGQIKMIIAPNLVYSDTSDLVYYQIMDMETSEILWSENKEEQAAIEEKKLVALLQKVVERLDAHLKALPGPIECGLSDNYKEFILETKLEA